MNRAQNTFKTEQRQGPLLSWGDLLALGAVAIFIYVAIRFSFYAPAVIQGPAISLAPQALPWYAVLSLGRMTAAYGLSVLFMLVYGRAAASNPQAEKIMMPLLDVLQSVPILSFLPVVLLGLSALLNDKLAAELASIVLIFTSQAWNLTFAWYQSLSTIPKDLREAAAIYRLNAWFRFKRLELPFAAISLTWNSMMSWAGGWFYLMAAEIFTVGQRDFRLPGLGAYLREAADQGDLRAVGLGLGVLVLLIVALDQLVWRPMLAWTERFKVQMVSSDDEATSWVYDALRSARLISRVNDRLFQPLSELIDATMLKRIPTASQRAANGPASGLANRIFAGLAIIGLGFGVPQIVNMLSRVPAQDWGMIAVGVIATFLRVTAALLVALCIAIPLGITIGTNRRLAVLLQPLVQITASVPATALFPVFLIFMLKIPGGLNLAAVLLMLMGTVWYLLFNIIAGASAIPQDLKYTATLMHLTGFRRWRTLMLPALFPYIVTGAITASGGAWNASIVAEYVTFSGSTFRTLGIGSQIAEATASGNYPLLLAATLSMILAVVLINRLVWRNLYRLAEEKYRME